MKRIALMIVCSALCFVSAKAQYKFSPVDASVADMVYYPLTAASKNLPPQIKIVYSRPLKKGREILGVVEPFGKVWRAGANESTEIHFFTSVKIGDKQIPAGAYSLFAIPEKDKWTVIINGKINSWGAFTYDQSKDIARVTVPVKTLTDPVEAFSITFTDAPDGANLIMGWEKTAVEVPISFSKQ